MDSQGLGALIGCLKALQQADGRMVLANVPSAVDSVLRVTRLHRVFDARPTVADALRALDAPAPVPAAGPAQGVGP
jgi:anti-sigma B factor antagonist